MSTPGLQDLQAPIHSRKYPAYPTWRSSRVWGVAHLPSHWIEKPLSSIVAINTDKLNEDTAPDFEMDYVDIGNVNLQSGITSTERFSFEKAPSRARRKVQHGDTIISTVRTYLKAVAHIINPPENLIVSTGFAVLRPKRSLHHGYLYRLIQSDLLVERIMAHSFGVSYPAINATEIGKFTIPLPALEEQKAIAAFLDRETARIDELIAKKRRLIELLQIKRKALISRAVTKGLDPNAKMKPSGIDWLGDIPEHWVMKQLKHVASVKAGYAFSSEDFVDEGVSVLRIGDIYDDGIVLLDHTKYLPQNFLLTHSGFRLTEGDIVMAMTGATVGKAGRFPAGQTALLNQRVCVLKPLSGIKNNYLWYVINSDYYAKYVSLEAFGDAQPNISDKQLLSCLVLVPDISEQHNIIQHLEKQTELFRGLVYQVQRAISGIQQYRSALITAAVTGQIDVRHYRAEVPE